jgi:hypothetical protein
MPGYNLPNYLAYAYLAKVIRYKMPIPSANKVQISQALQILECEDMNAILSVTSMVVEIPVPPQSRAEYFHRECAMAMVSRAVLMSWLSCRVTAQRCCCETATLLFLGKDH